MTGVLLADTAKHGLEFCTVATPDVPVRATLRILLCESSMLENGDRTFLCHAVNTDDRHCIETLLGWSSKTFVRFTSTVVDLKLLESCKSSEFVDMDVLSTAFRCLSRTLQVITLSEWGEADRSRAKNCMSPRTLTLMWMRDMRTYARVSGRLTF